MPMLPDSIVVSTLHMLWLAQPRANNGYGQYLQRLLKEVVQP